MKNRAGVRPVARWVALLLALTLVAAACGDDDDGSAFGGGGDTSGASTADFCAIAADQEALDASVNGGEVNIFDPDAFRTAFDELLELTDRAADAAPEEIRADFAIVRDGLNEVRDQLEGVDYDITAIAEEDFTDTLEQDAASERIEAFIERECGITDNGAELSEEQLQEQAEEAGVANGLIAEGFVQAGLTVEQANCLAESVSFEELIELSESGDTPPPELFAAFDECGVSLAQLAELGAMSGDDLGEMDLGEELGEESVEDLIESMPDVDTAPVPSGDLPPEAIEIFVSTLVSEGFTDAEARCLAPVFLSGDNPDPVQAFEDCGISLSRLAEIGG